jgi:hypothetical protein
MTGDEARDDQDLLARLGAIAQTADGPPDLTYELGRAAFAWRTVESELAQLVADSDLQSALVRSTASDTRLLSYATEDTTIEIELSVRGGRRSLLGQVLPERPAPGWVVRAETDTGPATPAPLDPVGRFEIHDVVGDRLRLRIEAPGATAVTTVWVNL